MRIQWYSVLKISLVQRTSPSVSRVPGFAPAAVIGAQRRWITEKGKNLGARISSDSLTVVPVVPTWTATGRDHPRRR
jgi:hypothetical protein